MTLAQARAVQAAVQTKLEARDYINITDDDFNVYVNVCCFDRVDKCLDMAAAMINDHASCINTGTPLEYQNEWINNFYENKNDALAIAIVRMYFENRIAHTKPT